MTSDALLCLVLIDPVIAVVTLSTIHSSSSRIFDFLLPIGCVKRADSDTLVALLPLQLLLPLVLPALIAVPMD